MQEEFDSPRVYQIKEKYIMSNTTIECHMCTHSQGYYGNLFLWFFNLHNGFLTAPLRPRETVKANDTSDEYMQKSNNKNFHFRPDDYHKFFVSDMDWDTHVDNVKEEQRTSHWRPAQRFDKIVVKPNIHAAHRLVKLQLYYTLTPTVVYNLTVDENNNEFFAKLAKRLNLLNNNDSTTVNGLKEQHMLASNAIKEISKKHTVCNVDVHKLFFENDEDEYRNVLKYLDTDPLPRWTHKLRYAKELINE